MKLPFFFDSTNPTWFVARYANMFVVKSGRCEMTWFAQNTQTLATPVVQRLIAAGVQAAKVHGLPTKQTEAMLATACSSSDKILLFCRKLKDPYVYCGELALVVVDGGKQPLKFTWNLSDSASLLKTALFRDLLKAAA